MILGNVTDEREAVIELTLNSRSAEPATISAVIDTGFNGTLTLPKSTVEQLELEFVGNRTATLADGSDIVLDMFLATIEWDGEECEVLALQSDGGPLIGMELLWGFSMSMQVESNGRVEIVGNLP